MKRARVYSGPPVTFGTYDNVYWAMHSQFGPLGARATGGVLHLEALGSCN